MLQTGYVIDKRFEDHYSSAHHPERPERISTISQIMRECERDQLVRIDAKSASPESILLNHGNSLFEAVRATADMDSFPFDKDTWACSSTFETALLAVGSLLAIVDTIMHAEIDNGFALVRPPGHHAEFDRAMGFCFFNNVAIAAHHLKKSYGLSRILIIDWDVHHGNGTQNSFFTDENVLYISVHQSPLYPGTGAVPEWGVGPGTGYTLNIPCPQGFGDAEYVTIFDSLIIPAALRFNPEFVLVSAGFDCHSLDPLGGMQVTSHGFQKMTQQLLSIARDCCNGRLGLVLEGGYSLKALSEAVPTVMRELATYEDSAPITVPHSAELIIKRILKDHVYF